MTAPRHLVVLDTDIGSDVDDAMALALILGTPDLDLLGVTTVYGDTVLKARLAQRYAGLAGRAITVCAGLAEPRSGVDVWWAGHEGSLHEQLDGEQISLEPAVDYLTRVALERPGQIDIIAIGPLTNIAAALDAEPAFEQAVRGLWIMGGSFASGDTEHNFSADSDAAQRVFASRIPTVVTALEITTSVRVAQGQIAQLDDAGRLGAALARDIEQWWRFWGGEWSVPHDPIAVLSLARPELFQLSPPGVIRIETERSDQEGASTFLPTGSGSVRLVTGLNPDGAVSAIVGGIGAASRLRDWA